MLRATTRENIVNEILIKKRTNRYFYMAVLYKLSGKGI